MKFFSKLFHGDITLWIIYFFFGVISLVEVYSATSQLTYHTAHYYQPVLDHAKNLLIAASTAWIVHWFPWHVFKRASLWGLVTMVAFLAYLALTKAGSTNGGARWINIGFNFQPSEFAKLFLILYTAVVLHMPRHSEEEARQVWLYIVIPAGITCAFIFSENISTAAILWFVILAMMTIGRLPRKHLTWLWGLTLGALMAGVVFVKTIPNDSPVFDFPLMGRVQTLKVRMERKFATVTPETVKDFDYDQIRQRVHANTAIANANFVGRMPGNSKERDYLSQAYSDFIFAIILEELGLWGGGLVILLYLMLLIRIGRIAKKCRRGFPAYAITGLVLMICIQALLNMLVAVDSFFITGQPLPFISRGGSSLLCSGIEMGIFLSVSRYVTRLQREKELAEAQTNPGLTPEPASAEGAFDSIDDYREDDE